MPREHLLDEESVQIMVGIGAPVGEDGPSVVKVGREAGGREHPATVAIPASTRWPTSPAARICARPFPANALMQPWRTGQSRRERGVPHSWFDQSFQHGHRLDDRLPLGLRAVLLQDTGQPGTTGLPVPLGAFTAGVGESDAPLAAVLGIGVTFHEPETGERPDRGGHGLRSYTFQSREVTT